MARNRCLERRRETPPTLVTIGRRLTVLSISSLGEVRGLHCGCGDNVLPGWLNVDITEQKDVNDRIVDFGSLIDCGADRWYLRHDATRRFPLDDASVNWVFAEHFVEHIPLQAAIGWLREMRRLLRIGGHIRISTPDLRRYIAGYAAPDSGFFAEHGRRLESMGNQVPARPAWFVNQIFRFWGHQWLYDLDEIRFAAQQAGFLARDIRPCAFRRGLVEEVAALDLAIRNDESLYVELVRSVS